MASGTNTSWQINGKKIETVTDFIFLNPKSLWTVTTAMKLKDARSLKEAAWGCDIQNDDCS